MRSRAPVLLICLVAAWPGPACGPAETVVETEVLGARVVVTPGEPERLADVTVVAAVTGIAADTAPVVDRAFVVSPRGGAALALELASDDPGPTIGIRPLRLVNAGTTNAELVRLCGARATVAVFVGSAAGRERALTSRFSDTVVRCR